MAIIVWQWGKIQYRKGYTESYGKIMKALGVPDGYIISGVSYKKVEDKR